MFFSVISSVEPYITNVYIFEKPYLLFIVFLVPASGLGDQSFNDSTYAGLYTVLSEILAGSVVPGMHHFDLENGGVSLTSMLLSRGVVTDEVRYALQTVKEKIITQKIIVTDTLKVPLTFETSTNK